MKYYLDESLVSVIASMELGLPTSEELSEDALKKNLHSCLRAHKFFVPDLSVLFGNLRLGKSGDCRRRVLKLFRSLDKIICENCRKKFLERDIN